MSMQKTWGIAAGTLLLLVACHRPAPPAETPSPETPAPATQATQAGEAPTATVAPVPVPQIAAAASAASKGHPDLSSMKLASPAAKRGVAVDLHYQFDGDVRSGQPVTLHLAAVPRVEGSNLKVSIKDDPGVQAKTNAISIQKAAVSTAYREQVSVMKQAGGPSELRVLVTMDTPQGSAFGWFGVPLGGAAAGDKQVKATLE
jgi:hypothetical protein